MPRWRGSAMVAESIEWLCENPVAVATAASAHIESNEVDEALSSETRCERWSAAISCRTARGRKVLDCQGLTKVRSAHEVPNANPKQPSLANPLQNPCAARTSPPRPLPRILIWGSIETPHPGTSVPPESAPFPGFLPGAPLKRRPCSQDLCRVLSPFPGCLSGAPLKPVGQ